MQLRKREMKKPIRDTTTTTRKSIKRCETRTTNPRPCGGHDHTDSNNNKVEEEKENKEGRWSELTYEILDMIVKLIYVIDLINLRAVCKSWHSYSLSEFQPLKTTKVPWLMTFLDDDVNSSCKLVDPTYKRTYIVNDTKIKEKILYYMDVEDSKCGWLLMSSLGNSTSTFFLLYTPFSTQNNLIELPTLNSNKFCFATFSCAPSFGTGTSTSTTTQQDDDDCVVLAYNNSASGELSISTCRPGDHTWRTRHLGSYFPLLKVRSVVYSQGVFYCPSHTGSIGTFNVDRDEWVVLEPNSVSDQFKRDIKCGYGSIHLLQSDGEFWLVNLWISKEEWERPWLTIYRLDRSKMIWKLLKLRSMGDRSLFLMKGTSLAIELPKWMKHPKWKRIGFVCRNYRVGRDGKVMYFKLPIRPQARDPCYPCTNLYGPYDGQKNQIWIDPPL